MIEALKKKIVELEDEIGQAEVSADADVRKELLEDLERHIEELEARGGKLARHQTPAMTKHAKSTWPAPPRLPARQRRTGLLRALPSPRHSGAPSSCPRYLPARASPG